MALYRSPDYQTSFESIGLSLQEKKLNIDFRICDYLGFPIWTILPTFDLKSPQYLHWSLDKKFQNRFIT